jgi:hypothetical protein
MATVTFVILRYSHCCLTVVTLKISLSPSHHLEEQPRTGFYPACEIPKAHHRMPPSALGREDPWGSHLPALTETENLFSS